VVKDDYTVTVSLKSPHAAFLYNLARQGSVIIRAKRWTP
jgi:ABC-type transport system substrate-binding protein